MIKEQILEKLIDETKTELAKVTQAYETTKNLVQTGDLKSDGKYDTRATEANYLAGGQQARMQDLTHELQLLEETNIKRKENTVSIGSLVELELNGNTRQYFISPTAGGKMVNINGDVYMVISVFSPIGDAALSLEVDDEFEVDLKDQTRTYLIKSIN